MGFVYVELVIKGLRNSVKVRALVDTGVSYITVNQGVVEGIGLIETPYTVDLTLADGRKIKGKVYVAEVEVKNRKGPAFIAIAPTPTPLLGVHALETLGFKVNPVTGELEEVAPEGGYLL